MIPPRSRSATTKGASLGVCPNCETTIPAGRLLIEYESCTGPAAYAACPGCDDVVHPA